MPQSSGTKALWIAFYIILAFAVFAGGYLVYLQKSGSPQLTQQAQSDTTQQETVLEGTYVCLPHKDGSKPKECTPGLMTAQKDYYALDLAKVIAGGGNPKLSSGGKITAGGTVVAIEAISSDQWKQYPIKGIMAVEEIAKQ